MAAPHVQHHHVNKNDSCRMLGVYGVYVMSINVDHVECLVTSFVRTQPVVVAVAFVVACDLN